MLIRSKQCFRPGTTSVATVEIYNYEWWKHTANTDVSLSQTEQNKEGAGESSTIIYQPAKLFFAIAE